MQILFCRRTLNTLFTLNISFVLSYSFKTVPKDTFISEINRNTWKCVHYLFIDETNTSVQTIGIQTHQCGCVLTGLGNCAMETFLKELLHQKQSKLVSLSKMSINLSTFASLCKNCFLSYDDFQSHVCQKCSYILCCKILICRHMK